MRVKLPRYSKYKDSGVKWMGEVPEHWEFKALKYLATLNDDELSENTASDYEISYVDIGSVSLESGIEKTETMCFADAPSRARRKVREGDVLVSTVRTYLKAICSISHPPDNLVVSTGFSVVRPRKCLSPRFAHYALQSQTFVDNVIARSTGVSYPAINPTELQRIHLPLPSLPEQELIADHLEGETYKLDALVNEQRRLIDLLKEKRQTAISDAVTKGLNPDTAMKPSGIAWIGDIPSHWDVERTRWLLKERDERSETGDEEMLTVSHLTGVTPRSEKNVTMFEAETNEGYKLCHAGDLVINTLWAWMGAMGVAPIFGMVSPAYNVYVPGKRILPSYVDSLVRMPLFAQEVIRYSKGVWTSRLRLYPEGLYQAFWPVPPLGEQKEIAKYIASESSRIDSLMLEANKSIELLQEHRSTLISNAVTGQIDVRKYRPQEASAVCQ